MTNRSLSRTGSSRLHSRTTAFPDAVLSELSGGSRSRVSRLSPGDTMARLIRMSPWSCYDRSTAAEHLAALSALARQSAAYSLLAGTDLLDPETSATLVAGYTCAYEHEPRAPERVNARLRATPADGRADQRLQSALQLLPARRGRALPQSGELSSGRSLRPRRPGRARRSWASSKSCSRAASRRFTGSSGTFSRPWPGCP